MPWSFKKKKKKCCLMNTQILILFVTDANNEASEIAENIECIANDQHPVSSCQLPNIQHLHGVSRDHRAREYIADFPNGIC